MRPLAALSMTLLVSCASMTQQSESKALETTLVAYGNAIRWGDLQQALPFVDPETLKAHPLSALDEQRYKQVRFVSYIEQAPIPVGEHQVRQVVRIGILNVNTQVERDIVDNQLWRYDPTSKHWRIVSGLPDITHHADP